MYSLQLDVVSFLRDYWQQQPLVIRQGFLNFVDLLDEHDLAGLSELDEVDSRIIQHHQKQWHVSHGPFDDFSKVCNGQWTLLVQGVDRYIGDASDLIEAFNFVPYWRMDDLMVSYASPGAGVGPHLDQYDVFLVQGKGRRRWKVGKPGNHTPAFVHPQIAQIEPFEPLIDVVLEPGDILYVPPGWPHEGVAEENCLTYSVGFRAPDQQQLINALPDIFDEDNTTNVRYTDVARQHSNHPSKISRSEITTLKSMILDVVTQPQWEQALMRLLSDQQLSTQTPSTLMQCQQLAESLDNGDEYVRIPACRPLFSDCAFSSEFCFYINGEAFTYGGENLEALLILLKGDPINNIFVKHYKPDDAFFELLTTLINKGYWEQTEDF